jgi:hypothetical protein
MLDVAENFTRPASLMQFADQPAAFCRIKNVIYSLF